MNTKDLANSLKALFDELIDGAPKTGAYMLNRGDPGLLKSLDRLSAADASKIHGDGSSIAAHVDHLTYGLSLMNRWAAGANPFKGANWAAAWERTTVSEAEWAERRNALRQEAANWSKALGTPRDVSDIELNGMIGSIGHLAYHIGRRNRTVLAFLTYGRFSHWPGRRTGVRGGYSRSVRSIWLLNRGAGIDGWVGSEQSQDGPV